MRVIRNMGRIDKFMSAEDALQSILKVDTLQYYYGPFAIKDIISEACKCEWNDTLEEGCKFITMIMNSVLETAGEYISGEEREEYLSLKDAVYEDMIKNIAFVNDVFDRLSIPYHFFTYEENGIDKIKVQRDGGVF